MILTMGCSSIVLHPIEQSDIFFISTGSIVKAPDGKEIKVQKEGLFLSDVYFQKVLKAKKAK